MIAFPMLPMVPTEQRGGGSALLRFEDFTQDRRLTLLAITQATGPMVWGSLLAQHFAWRALREQGIYPILSRMFVEAHPGSFGPDPFVTPLPWAGGYQFAHTGSTQAALRLLLNLWAEIGPKSEERAASPSLSFAQTAPGGRFFAEHVFTRPSAPPEQRKVLRFNVPGFPKIPEDQHPSRPFDEIITLPLDATPLEPSLSPDVSPIVFGICHTDSNQHVNSHVYPRLFEEAALCRLFTLGVSAPVLAQSLEIGYRKPCFAGDRVRIVLQAFSLGERWGAIGAFIPEGDVTTIERARPHCYVRMLFER